MQTEISEVLDDIFSYSYVEGNIVYLSHYYITRLLLLY